jgi:hypothetical protein
VYTANRQAGYVDLSADLHQVIPWLKGCPAGCDSCVCRDLDHRRALFPIQLPSLRERPKDSPLLATFGITGKIHQLAQNADRITSDILYRLTVLTGARDFDLDGALWTLRRFPWIYLPGRCRTPTTTTSLNYLKRAPGGPGNAC